MWRRCPSVDAHPARHGAQSQNGSHRRGCSLLSEINRFGSWVFVSGRTSLLLMSTLLPFSSSWVIIVTDKHLLRVISPPSESEGEEHRRSFNVWTKKCFRRQVGGNSSTRNRIDRREKTTRIEKLISTSAACRIRKSGIKVFPKQHKQQDCIKNKHLEKNVRKNRNNYTTKQPKH